MTTGGVTSLVLADRSGFPPSGSFTFYYLTPDCSDAPNSPGSATTLAPIGRVTNSVLWVVNNTGSSKDLAVGSPVFIRNNFGTDVCTATTVNTATKLYPVQSFDLSTFVPPFRIE